MKDTSDVGSSSCSPGLTFTIINNTEFQILGWSDSKISDTGLTFVTFLHSAQLIPSLTKDRSAV